MVRKISLIWLAGFGFGADNSFFAALDLCINAEKLPETIKARILSESFVDDHDRLTALLAAFVRVQLVDILREEVLEMRSERY